VPKANGATHYTNGKGFHLYIQSGGKWCFSTVFNPATIDEGDRHCVSFSSFL
jgi:hypothetical protein